MKHSIGIKSIAIGLPKEYKTPDQIEKTLINYDASKRTFKQFCNDFLGTQIMYSASREEKVSDLMATAAKKAINRAGISISDLSAIIVTTCSDNDKAASRAKVMKELGLDNISGIDIRAGCSGFPTAMHWTKDFVSNTKNVPKDKFALYVCGDTLRKFLKPGDIVTNGLFSDGAVAIIVGQCDEQYGFKATYSKTRPALFEDAGNDIHGYITLNGKVLKEEALLRFPRLVKDAAEKNGWNIFDVKIAPHLMNGPINKAWRDAMCIPEENFVDAVHLYGNTSAASQGIAIYELWKTNQLIKNTKVIGPAVGVGWDEAYTSFVMGEDLLPDKKKIRLLLIDDNDILAHSQSEMIELYFSKFSELRYLNSLEIDLAYSVDMAFNMLSKNKYDGIIADQRMPYESGGTGTDLLQKLKIINPNIVAVIVSGASEDSDRYIMTDLKNVVGYIEKPLITNLLQDLNDPNPDNNKLRKLFNFFESYNLFQN
ncbi:MAG: 3-oxoacyl-[acyl-carrier-protein] synthase III C-terminal domain-containing protein [Candidatus Woesearchaeota archaeon]